MSDGGDEMPVWEDREFYDDEAPGGAEIRMLPGAFRCTDLGNAGRFLARFRADVLFSAERDKWAIWNGHEWAWDETLKIEQMAQEVAIEILVEASAEKDMNRRKDLTKWSMKSEGRGSLAAMVHLARTKVARKVSALDLDPMLLNCANGTVDLETGVLREARRDDLITKTTGVRFVPGARSDLWDAVLDTATGGDKELAAYLQRMSGYACTGRATERAFFFLQGPPGTGKSTVIDALRAALGTYAVSTSFDTWLARPQVGGNRPDLVDLQGVRLVTSGECRKGVKWDTALIKGITGGDPIKASAKFENEVEFFSQATIVLGANDLPSANEDDDGFWERMKRVPFVAVVPVERRVANIRELLRQPENAEAILAWCVEGCLAWQTHGLGKCPVVEAATAEYRDQADIFKQFVEDHFDLVPGIKLSYPVFSKHYKEWARNEDIRHTMNSKQLAQALARYGVTTQKTNKTRFWIGLQLKDEVQSVSGYYDEIPI